MLDELMATGMDRQDMLDVFINTQEEDFLESLQCVFREAVNARGANKQQLFFVFWLMVLIGRQAGFHVPLPIEAYEWVASETSFLL